MNARLPLGALPPLRSAAAGLQARAVTVRAGVQPLLQGVSVALPPGKVGAILGPNGAGKSTLLNALGGLRVPQSGEVLFDGEPLAPARLPELARRRAVMQQDSSVAFDFPAQSVVELGRYPHRHHPTADEAGIVQAALQLADVAHLATRRVNTLSGGERARVQLARALAQVWTPCPAGRSRWLLLDEPTAALDLQHQHHTLATVRRWAREQGVGVVAVLHDLNLALRYADHVWVLDRGCLVASGEPPVVLSPERATSVWHVHASAVRDVDGVVQMLTRPEADQGTT